MAGAREIAVMMWASLGACGCCCLPLGGGNAGTADAGSVLVATPPAVRAPSSTDTDAGTRARATGSPAQRGARRSAAGRNAVHDAPLILDAESAFSRARPFETVALEHSVAVCRLGFAPRRGRGVDRVASAVAGVATLGLSTLAENADEPDYAGIDLVLGARFGSGPLYRALGAFSSHRTAVSFPIASLRAGDPVWMRLRDADTLSSDEILGEWRLRFTGRSPLVARHGRASVECRFLPREVVERRVEEALGRARRAIATVERRSVLARDRAESAERPLELFARDFDTAAARASDQIAIARANTSDPGAWPSLMEAERALGAALAPVAAARRARLERGFEDAADAGPSAAAGPAFTASAVELCRQRPQEVFLAVSRTPAPERGARRPRIDAAFVIDSRGIARPVRFRSTRPLRADDPRERATIGTASLGGFDRTGWLACRAPDVLLVEIGRAEHVVRVTH